MCVKDALPLCHVPVRDVISVTGKKADKKSWLEQWIEKQEVVKRSVYSVILW